MIRIVLEEIEVEMMDANQIIDFISNAKKSTPVKVYVKGSKLISY